MKDLSVLNVGYTMLLALVVAIGSGALVMVLSLKVMIELFGLSKEDPLVIAIAVGSLAVCVLAISTVMMRSYINTHRDLSWTAGKNVGYKDGCEDMVLTSVPSEEDTSESEESATTDSA